MVAHPILDKAKTQMEKAEQALSRELGTIRAGRANAGLLQRIMVDYYGTQTPINQVASITVPEPRILMVTPYDKSALEEIEKAIMTSDLGISPANDGTVIRLAIPQLTTERRQELAKEVKKQAEVAKVAVRNARRDAVDDLKKAQKNNELTEDDLHDLEKEVQTLTDNAVKTMDAIAAEKAKEITEV